MSEKTKKEKHTVVKSRVYEIVKGSGKNLKLSKELFGKIDEYIEELVLKACDRAEGNKRKTIFPRDL